MKSKQVEVEIKKLFDKNELRRLEKAAKEKNKEKLADWAKQFEDTVHEEYNNRYEKTYKEILSGSINNFLIAMVYTLHFNEKCKFGNDRISDFMEDFMAVIDGFASGEYTPEEYRGILEKQKIYFKEEEIEWK